VDTLLSAEGAIRVLRRVIEHRGKPREIRMDIYPDTKIEEPTSRIYNHKKL